MTGYPKADIDPAALKVLLDAIQARTIEENLWMIK